MATKAIQKSGTKPIQQNGTKAIQRSATKTVQESGTKPSAIQANEKNARPTSMKSNKMQKKAWTNNLHGENQWKLTEANPTDGNQGDPTTCNQADPTKWNQSNPTKCNVDSSSPLTMAIRFICVIVHFPWIVVVGVSFQKHLVRVSPTHVRHPGVIR